MFNGYCESVSGGHCSIPVSSFYSLCVSLFLNQRLIQQVMSVCFTSLYWSVTKWGHRKLVKLSVCRLTSLIFRNMEMCGGWSLFRVLKHKVMQGKEQPMCRQRKREKRQTLFLTCCLQIILEWWYLWGELNGSCSVCNLKCFVFTFWIYYFLLCVEFIYL